MHMLLRDISLHADTFARLPDLPIDILPCVTDSITNASRLGAGWGVYHYPYAPSLPGELVQLTSDK